MENQIYEESSKDLVLRYSKELLYGHMMLHFLLGSISWVLSRMETITN